MKYLSIKNWSRYQHYSKRHPPWVKLHVSILDDYEFFCLQDASKAHLLLLFVLASKYQNRIPYDLALISQKIGATTAVDIEELVLQGFIEVSQDDGRMLAPRKQNGGTETETETEKRQRKTKAPADAGNGNWVAEGSGVWAEAVAPIEPGRFGKALKPMVQKYGWPDTLLALRFYIEDTEGKPRRVEWFVADAVRCVRLGKMKLMDDQGGLTERGELARRQIARMA